MGLFCPATSNPASDSTPTGARTPDIQPIGDDILPSAVEPAGFAQLAGYPEPTGEVDMPDFAAVLCQFELVHRPHSPVHNLSGAQIVLESPSVAKTCAQGLSV